MTFLEYSRNLIFWSLDFLKKNGVAKHLKEIEFLNENPICKASIDRKRALILKLTSHAKNTTKFYSKIKSNNIDDFPIIDKQILMEFPEDFLSSVFNKKELIKFSTSGSTGVPFISYKNKDKINRNTADTIYFSKLANYQLGNKLIYSRLWAKKYMKSKFEFLIFNIVPQHILKNSKEEILDFITMLKKIKSSKVLMIYPSYLEEICRFLDATDQYNANDINLKSIITISEQLNDYERERAQFYFKAPIFERYSNTENGIIAQSIVDNNAIFQINHASYYIEILDVKTNKHVKNGEVGKVIITDLHNYAVPLIRYDTGDLATYKKADNEHPVLLNIFGRRMDAIFDTKGNYVSPHVFFMIQQYSKLKQYQFIQNAKGSYTFKLIAKKEDTQEEVMIEHFKKYLGDDAIFHFEYVDEIILLSSGKRKKVVNLMSS